MSRLNGKTALITGAASGLGEAMAELFVKEGAKVAIADIQEEKGRALAARLGDNALFVSLDVKHEEEWKQAVAQTVAQFGRLDILVNNAGGSDTATRLDREDPARHAHWVQINLTGVWNGIRAVIPPMQAQGGGSIINISSIAGITGAGGMTTYTATKFAVTGLTRSTALELGDLGIRVNSIHPGMTNTPGMNALDPNMLDGIHQLVSRQPIKRMGRPEEIARATLFFASDDSSYCTGSMLVVDGGMTAGRYRDLSD